MKLLFFRHNQITVCFSLRWKNLLYITLLGVSLLLFVGCGIQKYLRDRPNLSALSSVDTARVKHSDTYYTVGNNSLRKNADGLWEMYVEGNALQRGYAMGSLSRELIKKQEDAFMELVLSKVDSELYLGFLEKFLAWYNRKLYLHINEEYKEEIYGISRYNSHKYDYFARRYVRALYLHGAHDIGHALQDLMLVGCSSFAVWGKKTPDDKLLLGRNFDFYAGDKFAKQKIIAFVNPLKGYKYMTYTWPGFIGVVSGMNAKGLTVTLNAAKSKIPLVAKTPISLVAREILQYAKTTKEAIAIAKTKEVFVSESIMVGSAEENKAVIIEISPNDLDIYKVPNSASELVCTNHFQGKAYADNKRNRSAIKNSHTAQRYERLTQLLDRDQKITPRKAVTILRNKKGVNDSILGYGNELAINQLLAHHGIVFQPEQRRVWVSSNPYQLGAFDSYNLEKVFAHFEKGKKYDTTISNKDLRIKADPFLKTRAYKNYEVYRKESHKIEKKLKNRTILSDRELEHYLTLNPNMWKSYYLVGKYYYDHKAYKKAVIYFKQAKKRKVTTSLDRKMLTNYIKRSYRKF